jgi:hypothetical protein
MDNKIGETVIFNKDLHTPYYANLIDDLMVYNPSLKRIDNCELWGWNNDGEDNKPYYDYGKIADFNFEISKTETKLYYGDAPLLGYFEKDKSQLIILAVGAISPDFFHKTSFFDFKKTYPNPKSMWDLSIFIDDFLACRLSFLQELIMEHAQRYSKELVND